MNGDPQELWWRDRVAQNPAAIKRLYDLLVMRPFHQEKMPDYRVFREFRTPAGRIDLFIVWPGAAAVIEFKRDTADEAAIGQVCRYAGTLAHMDYSYPRDRVNYGPTLLKAVVAAGFTSKAEYAAMGADVVLLQINAGTLVQFDSDTYADCDVPDDVHRFHFEPIYAYDEAHPAMRGA